MSQESRRQQLKVDATIIGQSGKSGSPGTVIVLIICI